MTDDKGVLSDVDCLTCSSAAEVNSVVDNEDLQLTLSFSGDDARARAEARSAAIVQRFPEASAEVIAQGDVVKVAVQFSCGAEKVICMMSARSLLAAD